MEHVRNGYGFDLAGARLVALPSGALLWPEQSMLVVSDLHLGKSERMARRGGALLPPYETRETLDRLAQDVARHDPGTVVCLGDSFDDLPAAHALQGEDVLALGRLMANRRWVWVEGNHDPGPLPFGGLQMAELPVRQVTFRHIAKPGTSGEVSGHYHPKASIRTRGAGVSRACFLIDRTRVVMPSFGTYTGGLHAHSDELTALMRPDALAVLLGPVPQPIPMPRGA
ncbi:putative phosphoesterase [Hasllibacter halocynthiae]|uniref:Putative phosphoesterase n=1 Tax=Hasllibacter halocynthiae TaxID=595589 RepID=A0A2T0X9N2_9RHOB|nr:ligase-associated DNA damage response endonuclease PdeM [Hasllibacter halocynthiae]PRY95633.1 putative phosphoesterase [Hasllibacter halocynthiae]